MTYRYCEEISLKQARQFIRMYFGSRARIPWGSKTFWVAGIHEVVDMPGLHLIGGSGGMMGVWVLPKAKEGEVAA